MYQNGYMGDGMTATDLVQRQPVEVLATIHLPKNRRINIDRALESIFDALAVDESVKHIDAVFIRVYRGTK